jgi:hypothetical protein
MTKLIDRWIAQKIGYSLIDLKFHTIIPKQQLAERAKEMKARSMISNHAGDRYN